MYLWQESIREGLDQFCEAAAGWAEDRVSLLTGPSEETVFVAPLAWDTTEEAQEFVDFVESHTGISEKGSVQINGDGVLVVLSPDQAVVATVRAQLPGF